MKPRLLFLCGSLDPGRDGVGDYTRRLAVCAAEQGAAVKVVALNDPAVTAPRQEEAELLRLSSRARWSERAAQLQSAIAEFQPDWLSLQFVPYAYSPLGIVRDLNRTLQRLAPLPPAHLMFHETWITTTPGAPWKHRLIGLLQRRQVRRLLALLQPRVIHTSNATYQSLLARSGLRSEILPLFGSIPVTSESGDDWLGPQLQSAGVELTSANRPQFWVFAFFGSLYPEWTPDALLKQIQKAARAAGRRCVFISIGHLREGRATWDRFAHSHASEHAFVRLGEQPASRVSGLLSFADAGITPVPLALLGKSGTATAMLEHGLPVLVSRTDVLSTAEVAAWNERGVYPSHDQLARQLQEGLSRPARGSRLAEITRDFLAQLR